MTTRRPRGRRSGGEDVRAQIVAVALAEFGARGYDAASIRGIARAAGVDPALVRYYFPDGKGELFAAAVAARDLNPVAITTELLAGGLEGLGARLIETVVALWDGPGGRDRFRLVFGAAASADGDVMLREFLMREVFGRVAAEMEGPDVPERVSLFASHMIGILVARHVLEVEPLASMSAADLARRAGPVIQHYLDGTP